MTSSGHGEDPITASGPAGEPDAAPRRVLVTGGASGIGLACAESLAARGRQVQVADLRPGPGRHGLDVADRACWERVPDAAGPIEALVNRAGRLGAPEQAAWLMDRVPMARVGEPEEIAATAAFPLSTDASYLTGAVIPVDGAWTAA